ncbi:MAG: hypothetical protein IJV90_00995 [Candidatus Methanomethylophilaceae archaeon]|nr:hypothetical protein [Candidatus Methanomethylophilaceae archaeon]
MVVKSIRGRRRYLACTVPSGTNRDEVIALFEESASEIPQLKVITSFKGEAVIRCSPGHEETVVEVLRSRWPESESVLSSGTLRALRDKRPELKVQRRHKR